MRKMAFFPALAVFGVCLSERVIEVRIVFFCFVLIFIFHQFTPTHEGLGKKRGEYRGRRSPSTHQAIYLIKENKARKKNKTGEAKGRLGELTAGLDGGQWREQ